MGNLRSAKAELSITRGAEALRGVSFFGIPERWGVLILWKNPRDRVCGVSGKLEGDRFSLDRINPGRPREELSKWESSSNENGRSFHTTLSIHYRISCRGILVGGGGSTFNIFACYST